jgi:hypothetical protein
MSITDGNGGMTPADMAAVMGNNGNGFGFGGDGAWWILVLFLFAFMGNGWGNGYGGNAGAAPYFMNTNNDVQRGFDQSAVMNGISNLQTTIANGFSDAAVGQCNQTASMLQGFNGVGMQLNAAQNALQMQLMNNEMARQQCCCDTKQAIADLKYTIATENCADRAALSDGVRDIIANQTASVQMILDKMCQQEIEALKTQNTNLQTQLNMQNLAASQAVQTAQLIQDNNAQTAALINRIAPYPVPSYTVTNPYTPVTPTTA